MIIYSYISLKFFINIKSLPTKSSTGENYFNIKRNWFCIAFTLFLLTLPTPQKHLKGQTKIMPTIIPIIVIQTHLTNSLVHRTLRSSADIEISKTQMQSSGVCVAVGKGCAGNGRGWWRLCLWHKYTCKIGILHYYKSTFPESANEFILNTQQNDKEVFYQWLLGAPNLHPLLSQVMVWSPLCDHRHHWANTLPCTWLPAPSVLEIKCSVSHRPRRLVSKIIRVRG